MAKRKSISKGKRFGIFKRDGFTCQYCGQQPPDTVLHIDHILPVIEGGTNEEMNLVTSCAACNIGKGRKLLDRPQRPDADLAWLEKQQELAELRRYQESSAAKRTIIDEIAKSLQEFWLEQTGQDYYLDSQSLYRMLSSYGPELVEEGIMAIAPKVSAGYVNRYNSGWERYLWGILKHKSEGT